MEVAELIQLDFSGGLQSGIHPSKLEDNSYYFLQNARVREGGIKAVKAPLQISNGIPSTGKLQGVYAVGNYIVLFVDGKALFKDLTQPDTYPFQTITQFEMSPSVDVIYAQAVPISSSNFLRKAGADVSAPPTYITSNLSGTPACVVCQDGVNQPRLIFPDGSTRISNNYDAWQINDREYIPVGKQMCLADVTLYVLAPDGRSILRSVSGRYLDFVINIDGNGNKGGDAYTTSHSVNYNHLNAITPISGNEVANLFAGSSLSSHFIIPNFNDTVFGEPKFRNLGVMPTGPLNQFSFIDILGNSVIIDSKGLRSINATQQLLTESNNDIFSTPVFPFFSEVVQDVTCIGTYDNYVHFAVKTIYGYGVLVYDLSRKIFVSFDQYEGIGAIKQFAEAKVNNVYKLFFITTDNKLYEAYASPNVATATLYGKELCRFKPQEQLHFDEARVQFTNIISSGIINASAIVDRAEYNLGTQEVTANVRELSNPFPLNTGAGNKAYPVMFTNKWLSVGYSVGFRVSWNFEAELQSLSIKANINKQNVSNQQKAAKFAANPPVNAY